jgi:hypothetical protein
MEIRPATSNRSEGKMGMVAVLLLTAMLAISGIWAPAGATGLKAVIKSGESIPQGHTHHTPRPQGHIHFTPRAQGHIHFTHRPSDVPKHHGHTIHKHHGPVVVFPQPVYVVSPRRCTVPGYWAYTWVPQSYVANVWVPAHYNADALWVEGHYAPRTQTWGYYQPYWVPESWVEC